MRFRILSSGSHGNAILFDDSILLDAGISYKRLPPGIKVVLLTHCHGDHYNQTTIRNLHLLDESINFVCGTFLKENLLCAGIPENNIKTVEAGKQYKIAGVQFSPIALYHDVKNYGYRIMKNNYKILCATDTLSMEGITAKGYDLALLEANHCIKAATSIIEKKAELGEFCHLNRAIKTHLSVQKSVKFINENNIKNYVPVHIGGLTRNHVEKYIESNLINNGDKEL